jgi:hypothetical protein
MRTALLCRIAAVTLALLCCAGCGDDDSDNAASTQPAPQPAVEPGSNATPTNGASFHLISDDAATRLTTLQAVIVGLGHRCASVTKGVLTGGLAGTDEWRVDCSDSGAWQVWFSEDTGIQVYHCSDAKCD